MLLKNLLKSYLRKLTNLTASNRSLVVLRLYEDADLDLRTLEHVDRNRSSVQILDEIIKAKKQIHLCKYIDSRDVEINKCSNKLSKIFHKCKLIEQERGAKDLYIGYPFVTGKLNEGSIVRCPLLFFPVELQLINAKKDGNEWVIAPIAGELPFINRSFLLAYSHFNHVVLSEELLDFTFEDEFSDSLAFKNRLYEMLKASGLAINFNSEIFDNALKLFQKFSKSEYESQFENGILKLEPHCVLGIFPQSGSYLAPDYTTWLETVGEETVEDFYVEKNIVAKKVKEENILTAFPIDASQEQAIVAIKSGISMVVQGPPGTGKSQLISNLATDFAANGKKVLVVCQKRAALDVVHQRLSSLGFGDFVALVHDFKADRKKLYNQLHQQIESVDAYKSQNATLNAIVIERDFLHTCRNISETANELQDFRSALFDTQFLGISAKELYLKSSPNKPHVDLKVLSSKFNYGYFDAVSHRCAMLFDYAHIFERANFEWKQRNSFKNFTNADFNQIKSHIIEIQLFTSQVQFSYEHILQFYSLEVQWNNWLKTLGNETGLAVLRHSTAAKSKISFKSAFALIDDLRTLQNEPLVLFATFEEANLMLQKTDNAIRQHQNVFTKWAWKLFSKDKEIVANQLAANGLLLSKQDLSTLKINSTLGIKFSKTLQELQGNVKLNVKLGIGLKDNFEVVEIIALALKNAESVSKHQVLRTLMNYESDQWLLLFEDLVLHSRQLNAFHSLWIRYFTAHQLKLSFEYAHLPEDLLQSVSTHFDALVEYDKIISELSIIESELFFTCLHRFNDLQLEPNATPKSQFLAFVSNSLFLAWLNLIEQKYPILRSTETFKLAQLEQNLQNLVLKKQNLATDIIQLKLKEQTYEKNVFNRLNNRLTYRELQHQITKKKKIWTLRKLIEHFSVEIFDLAPIWLVSPETVSSIFPFEPVFDLIIFDEASQCFAEKGFPAMYRGKQIVIAGDSKQLQPSDLYLPRYEATDEADTDSEIDSLLRISEKYALQTTLTGHYRSLLPQLIAFSNAHFYENRLQLLPEYELMHQGKPPIHYIKTDGIWADNCNAVEAHKVLELALALLQSNPEKQIGIITFNAKQQDLIEVLFEKYSIEHHFSFPHWLFIKNIENVQGDERDIILFSTAYAPDISGKMQMQFGSLNQLHGENRLNVAITRAKEEIYIVTSIVPEQLQVENTLNEGPKLLKSYLKYAQMVASGTFQPENTAPMAFQTDWFLKNRLVEALPRTKIFELPFADLAQYAEDSSKVETLILTDDEYFHRAISAKDFFAYHPMALRNKHWNFSRYFSRTFWKNAPN